MRRTPCVRAAGLLMAACAGAAAGCSHRSQTTHGDGALSTGAAGQRQAGVPWSRNPPAGRDKSTVPQFVAVTFDDNFGLENPTAAGGVDFIVDFFRTRTNPRASGDTAADYGGTPIATTLFNTTLYMTEQDELHRNRASWRRAFAAGHEVADHTIHHWNGGGVPFSHEPCCRPRRFKITDWIPEIKGARDTLTDPAEGVGARSTDVVGFRAPYLGYNDALYSALVNLRFLYDSTLLACLGDDEDGGNCAWPYTLDNGSRDADTLKAKFGLPALGKHPGLWEAPVSALVVPPDSEAAAYGFTAGLRARIEQKLPLPYPSLYEPGTGKIAGLDVSLLTDAQVRPHEMLAILKYNLDLHRNGNRAPLVFVAHAFMYAFTQSDAAKPKDPDNPNTPSAAERDARWKAITDFVTYAISKPEVRVRPVKDIIAWMKKASP